MSIVANRLQDIKIKIRQSIEKNNLNTALALVSCASEILYNYNQVYTDDELENFLFEIIKKSSVNNTKWVSNSNTILFYDGFGFDKRGLVLQYLDALVSKGYKVIYVTDVKSKGLIPSICKLINPSQIYYLKEPLYFERFVEISRLVESIKPQAGFIYTTPNDVSGIVAFMSLKGKLDRYMINLTDHSFWIGVNSFDRIIEFRDYGASITHHKRGINKEQIIELPYYPIINYEMKFQGYPFQILDNTIVVFSGGALYKTFDKNNTYYQIVDYILSKYENVVFWYAGYGTGSQLELLQNKYHNRVFWTKERDDLFQVLSNIDIYFNTYPLIGGLMMQYSAIAGKAPITLKHNSDGDGILIDQTNLGIEFKTSSEVKACLSRMIEDRNFRDEKNERVKNSVITNVLFADNLDKIIHNCCTDYHVNFEMVDTHSLQESYKIDFQRKGVDYFIAKNRYRLLIKNYPFFFCRSIFWKVIYKIIRRS